MRLSEACRDEIVSFGQFKKAIKSFCETEANLLNRKFLQCRTSDQTQHYSSIKKSALMPHLAGARWGWKDDSEVLRGKSSASFSIGPFCKEKGNSLSRNRTTDAIHLRAARVCHLIPIKSPKVTVPAPSCLSNTLPIYFFLFTTTLCPLS